MQHVDDHMDDLFRRAAADYPLNTDSADWDAVTRKIADNSKAAEKNNYKHLLWLLLLIPAGLLYYFISNRGVHPQDTSVNTITSTNSTSSNTQKQIDNNKQEPAQQKGSESILPHLTQQSNPDDQSSPAVFNSRTRHTPGKLNAVMDHGEADVVKSETKTIILKNKSDENRPADLNTDQQQKVIINNIADNNIKTGNINPVEKNNSTSTIENLTDKKTTAVTEATPDANNNNNKSVQVKIKKPVRREHGLYAGVMISPDISSIKNQQVKKPGLGTGVLIGFHFNRLSVESGASWDVKYYYSNGSYFKTNNIRLPANTTINYVNGGCRMIEVPLIVRYNTGKHLSVAAGSSSYFMKREKYTYDVTRNGVEYPYTSTYKKASNHYFNMIDISAAYDQKITKTVSFRAEPYLKMPLKGMGIGSLPITSAGINLVITKKLTR